MVLMMLNFFKKKSTMCHYTEENEAVEIDIRRIQWLFAVVRKHRVVLDLPRKI